MRRPQFRLRSLFIVAVAIALECLFGHTFSSEESSTMYQIASFACLLIGSFMTCPALAADPLVVDLGRAFLLETSASRVRRKPKFTISADHRGTDEAITNVTDPTITIYQPAKVKSTERRC